MLLFKEHAGEEVAGRDIWPHGSPVPGITVDSIPLKNGFFLTASLLTLSLWKFLTLILFELS